ncbi:MAG TPA: hypothetical protein VK179_16955 [Bacteroidales bacterium]|nr:hypothetical protein [Bacteroidales bacterium]
MNKILLFLAVLILIYGCEKSSDTIQYPLTYVLYEVKLAGELKLYTGSNQIVDTFVINSFVRKIPENILNIDTAINGRDTIIFWSSDSVRFSKYKRWSDLSYADYQNDLLWNRAEDKHDDVILFPMRDTLVYSSEMINENTIDFYRNVGMYKPSIEYTKYSLYAGWVRLCDSYVAKGDAYSLEFPVFRFYLVKHISQSRYISSHIWNNFFNKNTGDYLSENDTLAVQEGFVRYKLLD